MLAVAGINSPVLAAQAPVAKKPGSPTILVVGDSLSAEYGLKRGTGWVALLEKKLTAEKIHAQVVNASISGDTTSGGRARLGGLLKQHQPHLVVIELGANDALRGLPLTMTQDNLTVMTQEAQKAGARVLLLGIQMPPNYGRDYGQHLTDMYAQVAKANRALLVPFFLKGVADVPDSLKWFQADRIHPLEAAHPVILANIWPELKKGLR
jgi:acyl-CoA thioesterase-1